MRVLGRDEWGVDSAVAAARAVDAGHDVVGVHLALSRNPATLRTGARGCCTQEDARDARRAADLLGIDFYVWDLSERFQQDVVDDFVAEYAAGRTPNPCVRCNQKIKFAALLDKAIALDLDAVATGHYARLAHTADGSVELHRAVDPGKDQSYVLAVLPQSGCGTRCSRSATPSRPTCAPRLWSGGLQVADKPDSHDICFIPDGDTRTWLGAKLGRRPGVVLDTAGAVVGAHQGAYAYTVGQRKGLALSDPAPDGRPRYVVSVEPVSNTVVVGAAEALDVTRLQPPVSSGAPRPRRPAPGSASRCGRTARRFPPCSAACTRTSR